MIIGWDQSYRTPKGLNFDVEINQRWKSSLKNPKIITTDHARTNLCFLIKNNTAILNSIHNKNGENCENSFSNWIDKYYQYKIIYYRSK